MISLGKSRIRNGFNIAIESVRIACKNPPLLVYLLALIAINLLAISFLQTEIQSYKQAVATFDVEAIKHAVYTNFTTFSLITKFLLRVLNLLVSCCLARHTMHILRQQPFGAHESITWVLSHLKQIFLFVIVFNLLILGGEILLPFSFLLVGLLGLLVLSIGLAFIIFSSDIMTPIISTEKISFGTAFKRGLRILWDNLGTYILLSLFLFIISGIITLFFAIIIKLLSPLPSEPIATVFALFLSTIANTIFYYLFYVKRELKPQENFKHLLTKQRRLVYGRRFFTQIMAWD